MMFRTTIIALAMVGTVSAALAGPKCTCRFQGHNYQIGEVACILGNLQQCEMQLNNTSWKMLSEGCPQASLQQSVPASPNVIVGSGKSVRIGSNVVINGQSVN